MVDLSYASEIRFILNILKLTNLKGMIIRVSWLNKLAVKFPTFSRGNSSLPDNAKTVAKKKKEEEAAREKELNELFKVAIS